MTRVLLVDDNPAHLFLLRSLLTGYDCDAVEARTAVAALAMARETPPDLFIASADVVAADGELLLQMRPALVYSTSRGDAHAEARARALGAVAFIQTSAEPAGFMAALREALGHAGAMLRPRSAVEHDERGLLREYSRWLVRTLEEKVRTLEERVRQLEQGPSPAAAPTPLTELRQIVEVAARTLKVARVAIWRYRPDRSAITAVDMFDAATGQHSSGAVLSASMYPAYFAAVAVAEVIAADDAVTDPRTWEFAEDYLVPRGIGSMLDVPTTVNGMRDGVLSHEHVGPPRQWTDDEKAFAVAMGTLVSRALERVPST